MYFSSEYVGRALIYRIGTIKSSQRYSSRSHNTYFDEKILDETCQFVVCNMGLLFFK